jgi:hypothetical protein
MQDNRQYRVLYPSEKTDITRASKSRLRYAHMHKNGTTSVTVYDIVQVRESTVHPSARVAKMKMNGSLCASDGIARYNMT